MSATTLHEQCGACGGRGMRWHSRPKGPDDPPEGSGACDDCGGTGRVDSPAALARLAGLEADCAKLDRINRDLMGEIVAGVARGYEDDAGLKGLEAEVALLRAALEWMASYGRSCLDSAKTLHYDMNGRAKHVLDQVAELRKAAGGGEGVDDGPG